mmetsp:Transcript_32486/g.58118  ORF Transcript_32486/g.58118 Transcript_32486/m.58118 type:complete len:291 (-) Transcript_32486:1021-1893(-)
MQSTAMQFAGCSSLTRFREIPFVRLQPPSRSECRGAAARSAAHEGSKLAAARNCEGSDQVPAPFLKRVLQRPCRPSVSQRSGGDKQPIPTAPERLCPCSCWVDHAIIYACVWGCSRYSRTINPPTHDFRTVAVEVRQLTAQEDEGQHSGANELKEASQGNTAEAGAGLLPGSTHVISPATRLRDQTEALAYMTKPARSPVHNTFKNRVPRITTEAKLRSMYTSNVAPPEDSLDRQYSSEPDSRRRVQAMEENKVRHCRMVQESNRNAPLYWLPQKSMNMCVSSTATRRRS